MKKTSTLLALSFILFSCKENSKNCHNAICTLEFRAITINIKSNNTDTVVLDSYYTLNTTTNDTALMNNSPFEGHNGSYAILTDSYINKMKNKTYQFRFVGIIAGNIVIDEPYTISADCCHISLVSGRSEITID